MTALNNTFEKFSRTQVLSLCGGLVAGIGLADYIAPYTVVFQAFYLLPVALASWYVGRFAGILVAGMSVVAWLAGDFAAGAPYSSLLVPVWNGAIVLTVYFVVIQTLVSLRKLQRELEERVRQRTLALAGEMQERARLERELVKIGEQSQRQFGCDLHDTLGQHLTATAFAGQVLTGQLEAKSLPETAAAKNLVKLIEGAIRLTRQFASGLQPVEMKPEGLMDGFQALARNTSERFKVTCEFECREPVLLHDAESSTHLYRIAAEAVTNAIKHGRPRFINISLENNDGVTVLMITDDGSGLPDVVPADGGMGLRIMSSRARIIGATFQIERLPDAGTCVTVTLPSAGAASKTNDIKN